MRIFVAGATGVIGMRLVPMLLGAGHEVAGMTRSAGKAAVVRELGAQPYVCDVYDPPRLNDAIAGFRAEMVMHQLTDLPDDADQIPLFAVRNDRIRTEGTRNLLTAAAAAGAKRFLAQSIAWKLPRGQDTVQAHERQVLNAGGLVVRYGKLYGPGTYYEDSLPPHPRIHVEAAAQRTMYVLAAEPGVVVLEDEHD